MVKAIIFDFDGLLFDSEPIWDRAYFEFIKIKNLRDIDLGDTTEMGLRELKIPLMITDPQRDYSTSYIPQNHDIITKITKNAKNKTSSKGLSAVG